MYFLNIITFFPFQSTDENTKSEMEASLITWKYILHLQWGQTWCMFGLKE